MYNEQTQAPCVVHFYSKTYDSGGLFYTDEDKLYFMTLLSCLVRRNHLSVLAVCLMFNHYHIVIRTGDIALCKRTLSTLERIFGKFYSIEYQRRGQIFKIPAGYAVKRTLKDARSCVIYVYNNPTVGGLCHSAIEYRWNLLALGYEMIQMADSQVQGTLRASQSGGAMMADSQQEEAVWPASQEKSNIEYRKMVIRSYYNAGKPLDYNALNFIFKGIADPDCKVLADYILRLYNFVDYQELDRIFGSLDNAVGVFDMVTGSDYDLRDDFDDYSVYEKMSEALGRWGYGRSNCGLICRLEADDISGLAMRMISELGVRPRQLRKFFHLL